MLRIKKYNFSTILVVAVILLFVADVLLEGFLKQKLLLTPFLVINYYEIWRLVTFPLVSGSVIGMMFFAFTFTIISPNIEKELNKKYYPLLITLLILLQGIITSLVFWKTNLEFSGMEGPSFFVLTLFTLLQRKKRVSVLSLKPVRLELFFTMLFMIWLSSLVLYSFSLKNVELLISGITSCVFGLISGSLFYIQLQINNNIKKLKKLSAMSLPKITPDEEPVLSHYKSKRINQTLPYEDEYDIPFEKYEFTEERLNEILDKINENGREALSLEEERYLWEYSNNLK